MLVMSIHKSTYSYSEGKPLANMAKTNGLTETQARFVHEYVMCGDVQRAAALAGYSDNAGGYMAYNTPAVQAAIKAETHKFLFLKAYPAALRLLYGISQDENADLKVRAEAGRFLIKAAHDFEKLNSVQGSSSTAKPLDQMSPEELKNNLERLEKELANRAAPLINAPITRHSDDKPL